MRKLISEEFLQYVWKYRLICTDLMTETGEPIVVVHPGEHNKGGGPDFVNARIKIGNTLWAGNVEIHVRASDWYRHNHHFDRSYDNTILHAVLDPDSRVALPNGQDIPLLKLAGTFSEKLVDGYRLMMASKEKIPCIGQLTSVDPAVFSLWAPGLTIERMEAKAKRIVSFEDRMKGDPEELLYRHLAYSFGFNVNSHPFELLARSLPLRVMRTVSDNLFQLEALLYGQAGMLDRPFMDAYPAALSSEYSHLRSKFSLKPLKPAPWKLLRLHPANFPQVRISQFARLLYSTRLDLMSLVREGEVARLSQALHLPASAYWDDHYLFDKPAPVLQKWLGEEGVRLLLINGCSVFIYYLGIRQGQPPMRERALDILEHLPPERNHIIGRWKNGGLIPRNALESQALLSLKANYCDQHRCLDCRIGATLLKKNIQ